MLAPLLVLAMAAQVRADLSPIDRGSDLFQKCQTDVRMTDNQNAGATSVDYQQAAACIAYIDGFTDGLQDGSYCVIGASLGTLARVYVAYMGKHPKLLDEYKSIGLVEALRDAYPCPKK